MAINKNAKTEAKKESAMQYIIKVTRAKENANRPNSYRFSMNVNGIDINGCNYITYTDRSGEQKSFISFPQYKGSDDKYYNHCYFKISDDDFKIIEQQIEKIINKE